MNARTNTRNASRIQRVLLDELLEEYVMEWIEHQEPEVLHAVLRHRTHQHRIAKRLHITLPDSDYLVGRVVAMAHIRSVRARKELQAGN